VALTEPFDILPDWPGWITEFELLYRQEQSRTAAGRTIVKDFGSPLWRMTAVSRSLSPNELDYWRARLEAMDGGLTTFKAYPLSRCRPILHPGSAALPAGTLHTIGGNRKSVRIDDLDGITLSIGDLICIDGRDLHRVVEGAATVTGLTPLFEVRPHLWADVVTGVAVSINRPFCLMSIVPGSITSSADAQTGRGSISFQAIEARDE